MDQNSLQIVHWKCKVVRNMVAENEVTISTHQRGKSSTYGEQSKRQRQQQRSRKSHRILLSGKEGKPQLLAIDVIETYNPAPRPLLPHRIQWWTNLFRWA